MPSDATPEDRWPSATAWARIDADGVVAYEQTREDRERRAYQP
jgi:hypothetical protein